MIESALYREHPAWRYFYGRFFFAGLFLILATEEGQTSAALILAIILILFVIYGRYRREYIVTSQRVSLKRGIIANNTREMEIQHIRGINIRQNILERLIGIGSLEMTSAADGSSRVVFQGVKNPEKIKDLIYSVRGTI